MSLGIADADQLTNFPEDGIRELRQQVCGYPIWPRGFSMGYSSQGLQFLIGRCEAGSDPCSHLWVTWGVYL